MEEETQQQTKDQEMNRDQAGKNGKNHGHIPKEPKGQVRAFRPILSSEVLAALQHYPLPLASLDALVELPKSRIPRTPPPTPYLEALDLHPIAPQPTGAEEDGWEQSTEEPPAEQPFLYKSNGSVPVLYKPDTTAIREEDDRVQPQAHEARETSHPTTSIYV